MGLIKKKRVKTQITNIRNETKETTTDTEGVKKKIEGYYEYLMSINE